MQSHRIDQLLDMLRSIPAATRDTWFENQSFDPSVEQQLRDALRAADDDATRLTDADHIPALATRASSPTWIASDHVSTSPAFTPGTGRLGPWRLLDVLGSGGMGVVHLAERADGAYEQQVAIKLLSLRGIEHDAALAQSLRQRFENERRLLARLEHPNVARIVDGGTADDGTPYLVMEYVDGDSIDVHARRAKLDVRARVQLLAKVCDGVQAAHRHLIVHRDLKPANILVDADGEPRVLDFGIARLLDDAQGGVRAETELYAMTPAYASPEQVRREELTTTSDVYSLGVIAYELLTGSKPYQLDGLSPAQVERLISDTRPTSLRRALDDSPLLLDQRRLHRSDINDDLERIVAKALHKDPERRYDTAQALGDDLRRFLRGLPVQAHPDSLGYRLRRFVGRNRLLTAATTLTLLAIFAGSGVALWQAEKAKRSADDSATINTFLLKLLSDSNPYTSGGEITLADAVDRAALRIDEVFAGRPDLAIDTRLALAESMLSRYQLETAEPLLQRTLDDVETLYGPNDIRAARALDGLASLSREQSRDDEAQALYDDALDRLERAGNTGDPLYSTILNNVGVLHLYQSDYQGASDYLQRALAADAQTDPPISDEERAQTLGNLAQAARGLGDLDRADNLYQQVQTIFKRIYPDGSPQLATLLNSRAILASTRENYDLAFNLQQQSVAMHQRSFSGDHVTILTSMTTLSRMAADVDNLALAADYAQQAVAMADRMYTKSPHTFQAQAHLALAIARLLQEQPDEAVIQIHLAETALSSLPQRNPGVDDYLDSVWDKLCKEFPTTNTDTCTLHQDHL